MKGPPSTPLPSSERLIPCLNLPRSSLLSVQCIYRGLKPDGAALITQVVKNLPAVQETLVQFLGREDPLEKGMAAHSSIRTWRILWPEEPGGLLFIWSQRV